MADVIPGGTTTDNEPGLPTVRRREALRDALLALNSDDRKAETMLDTISQMFNDIDDDETREAMKFAIFQRLKHVQGSNMNPLDIFMDDEVLGRARRLIEVEDHQDDSSVEMLSVVGNLRDTVRRAREVAYTDLGWLDGDGRTRRTPLIVGKLSAPPIVHPTTLALSVHKDLEQTSALRRRFTDFLYNFRWEGDRGGDQEPLWMRLHPWAVDYIANLFFHTFIGREFFERIDEVLQPLMEPIEGGNLTVPGRIETFIRTKGDAMSVGIKAMLQHLADTTRWRVAQSAYTEYMGTLHHVAFGMYYQDVVRALRRTLPERARDAALRQSMADILEVADVTPHDLATLLGRALNVVPEDIDMAYQDVIPAIPFCDRWTSVCLLVLSRDEMSRLHEYELGPLPQDILGEFDALVPEFGEVMGALREHLQPHIDDPDNIGLANLPGNGFQLRTEGVERREDWFAGASQALARLIQ